MAVVTGFTAARMLDIENNTVVDGHIDGLGHLILETHGGAEIDAGNALVAVPSASETQEGAVELATDAETLTGTSTVLATHPAGVKAVADTKQPLDGDLTAIAALTPTNDDVVQRKSGAWTNRSMSQLKTDLQAAGLIDGSAHLAAYIWNGSAYVAASGAGHYVGPSDPGAVPNGSIWDET